MSDPKLEPCIYCDEDAAQVDLEFCEYFVECGCCGARGLKYYDRKTVIDVWNKVALKYRSK